VSTSENLLRVYDNDLARERIEASLPLLRRNYTDFKYTDFMPAPPGDSNAVFTTNDAPAVVVKLPLLNFGSARDAVEFECEVVAHLETVDSESPLVIPGVVDCRSWTPYHMVFTKVSGEVLPHGKVCNFNVAE
jgi:hypothetical protein